jgi:hypothetical protein
MYASEKAHISNSSKKAPTRDEKAYVSEGAGSANMSGAHIGFDDNSSGNGKILFLRQITLENVAACLKRRIVFQQLIKSTIRDEKAYAPEWRIVQT